MHFFIGLGALVSPLVADPFLSEDSCVLGANWTANSSSSLNLQHLHSSMARHGAELHNISQYALHTEGVVITRVSYAFWIMALINVSYSRQYSVRHMIDGTEIVHVIVIDLMFWLECLLLVTL